ncbi:DUF934 domain-containing protein [Lichenihabitans psoromatis]|uniref:DUF934 domain-containing protein n=1 Tax=Lichenihabitans psoromatis TaxID=2528642 RepID=UPI001036E518|nr:DUF934 domain-containing protein [Lichenihabitans psoromatis]
MALYKNGAFIDNQWQAASADLPAPQGARLIFGLAQWKAVRDTLQGANQPVGLVLEAGEMIDDIIQDLPRFWVIALAFPKFGDGRAFSKAALLREHGFEGELRAVGDVLWDQLQLMARCGFDAFEIDNEPTLKAIRSGKSPFMTTFGQPGFGPETRDGTPRAWTRRAL